MDLLTSEISQKFLSNMQYKRLVLVAASAFLFLYDVLLSFNLELEYMWKSEWKIFKILYIIQRYLPVADTVIALPYRDFSVIISTGTFLKVTLQRTSHRSITMLPCPSRLEKSQDGDGHTRNSASWLLGSCFYFFLDMWASSLEYVKPPMENYQGCFLLRASNLVYRSLLMMMAFETSTLILILIPGVSAYRAGARSQILKIIYRDATLLMLNL
ncbi:hypothetical protein WG66_001074 [Moniliophthora roreri]|nr:hypothetical protein WG66_001074 [Moniliophthora roreri]